MLEINKRNNIIFGFGFTEESPQEELERGDSKNASNKSQKATALDSDSDTPVIDKYGIDLTSLAEEGVLDPLIGRTREIERIIQILSRRKKNNPIIIGEPGVGKSAIVEGLAQLINDKKVPHFLSGKRIISIEMASIVAGTQYRGQFEERIRRLIHELRCHKEFIVFIDEIHTIIGAGSSPGSLDAANILKPALARGYFQVIEATTISEFKKSIEKDGALERRFQKIMLDPPSSEETLNILKNLKTRYEEHHLVRYTDEALSTCIYLADRYITDRAFPDKAIDILDEAGSRVHLNSIRTPKEIQEKEIEIANLKERKVEAAKNQDYELAAHLRDTISDLNAELEELHKQWTRELKMKCEVVDEENIAEVVSIIKDIPVNKILQSENYRLRKMREVLSNQVINQERAIEKISRAIARSRLGLNNPQKPIGVFMFVGPTGVGKTLLVQCLAEWMFGNKDSLIRIDMSEYGEKHTTSRLVGSPPGYVGYEEGGQLTERVRRKPYSIILLDEIEKAHSDVFNTLLQVMDEGRMTDGNGSTIDFRNTIIVMTSNCGTRQLKDFGAGIGFQKETNNTQLSDTIINKALEKQFPPEFLNRIDDIILFNQLSLEDSQQITRNEIGILSERLMRRNLQISITEDIISFITQKGFSMEYGARSIKRAIQHFIENPICDFLMAEPEYNGLVSLQLENDIITIQKQ